MVNEEPHMRGIRFRYIATLAGVLISLVMLQWMPGSVTYQVSKSSILLISPLPVALLALFWRQYRGLSIYEKLNDIEKVRFDAIKSSIYRRICLYLFLCLGSSAIALLANYISKAYYPESQSITYVITTVFSTTIDIYLSITTLALIFETADFSDDLDAKTSRLDRKKAILDRLGQQD